MTDVDARLLQLNAADNILVVRSRLSAGDTIVIGGQPYTLPVEIPLGHKLAGRHIGAGEKILKYGAPIGSAMVNIPAGAHVHVHNIKSDYTPTHHLYDERARHGEDL